MSIGRDLAVALAAGLALTVVASAPADAKKKPKYYKVGQTAKSGDFKFTVFAFTDPTPPPSPVFTASPGSHFVTVDVEVINPSSKNRSFSAFDGFHLRDQENRQYRVDLTLTPNLNPPAPDGQIPPNGSTRGLVAFQVTDGTTKWKFRAQGGFTASGAIWKLY
jgi:uncharacterized protein DUF4352